MQLSFPHCLGLDIWVPKVMETNPRKAAGIQDAVEVPDQKTGTHKRAVIPEKEALRIGLRLGLPCPQASLVRTVQEYQQ